MYTLQSLGVQNETLPMRSESQLGHLDICSSYDTETETVKVFV